jgi:branched-chain amino acid transport system permease protein
MHALIQALILGVLTGGVYALMASGQTLIFGIMKVVNLAQGALIMLGAYMTYTLFTSFGIDPFVSLLITTPLLFLLGVGLQWALLRPLHGEDVAQLSLLVTFAIALGVEGALSFVYGATLTNIQPGYANESWTILGFQISIVRFWAFAISIVLLLALGVLLKRTKFGRSVRATVQNPESAKLLGVSASRVSAIGFGLGAATAAAGGAVFGMLNSFNPGSHYDLISKLLTVVILGGLGSIGGAIYAALIMGVISSVVAAVASPIWSDFAFFIVLLLVLLVRPQGLFGAKTRGAL